MSSGRSASSTPSSGSEGARTPPGAATRGAAPSWSRRRWLRGFSTFRARIFWSVVPILTEAAKTADELLVGRLPRGGSQPPEKRMIGVVRLGLSLEGIEHRMGGLIRVWAGVTVVFFALSTLAVYIFSRRVTGPVK